MIRIWGRPCITVKDNAWVRVLGRTWFGFGVGHAPDCKIVHGLGFRVGHGLGFRVGHGFGFRVGHMFGFRVGHWLGFRVEHAV